MKRLLVIKTLLVALVIFMSRSMTILKNFATMMQSPDDLAGVLSCANNQLC